MNLLHRLMSLFLVALLTLAVGCGTGTKQSPVASDSLEAGEEVGELEEDEYMEVDAPASVASDEEEEEEAAVASAPAAKSSTKSYTDTYRARSGDTLASIAGKEEIYGDSELWPILQEANRSKVGNSRKVNAGVTLKVPRRLTSEEMDEAREKARQFAASSSPASAAKASAPSEPESFDMGASGEGDMTADAGDAMMAEGADEGAEMTAPEPAQPKPVPKPKKKSMLLPILVVVFVVLLGAALILLYFMKKDNEEEEA